jgi:hypothetical protein
MWFGVSVEDGTKLSRVRHPAGGAGWPPLPLHRAAHRARRHARPHRIDWVIVGGESGPRGPHHKSGMGARHSNRQLSGGLEQDRWSRLELKTRHPPRQGLGPGGLEKDRWSRLELKTLHPPVRDWDRPWLFSGSDRARVAPRDIDPHSSGDDRTDATGAA